MYNVEHSFPLNSQQKANLAERITKLHATAFKTPSIFVQVKYFQEDASASNHYVGGEPQTESTNRITALVRSSAGRKKEHFDKLAEDIENAWYVVLGERSDDDEQEKNGTHHGTGSSPTESQAKELLSLIFIGGLMGREKGLPLPEVRFISCVLTMTALSSFIYERLPQSTVRTTSRTRTNFVLLGWRRRILVQTISQGLPASCRYG